MSVPQRSYTLVRMRKAVKRLSTPSLPYAALRAAACHGIGRHAIGCARPWHVSHVHQYDNADRDSNWAHDPHSHRQSRVQYLQSTLTVQLSTDHALYAAMADGDSVMRVSVPVRRAAGVGGASCAGCGEPTLSGSDCHAAGAPAIQS